MGSLVTIGFSEKGGAPADVALRDPLTVQNYHAGHRRWPIFWISCQIHAIGVHTHGGSPQPPGMTGIVLEGWGPSMLPQKYPSSATSSLASRTSLEYSARASSVSSVTLPALHQSHRGAIFSIC